MRKLHEITSAARLGETITDEEARLAICAYDVMLANLQHVPDALFEYFRAAELTPRQYIGPNNDPDNPEAVEWYKTWNETIKKLPDTIN